MTDRFGGKKIMDTEDWCHLCEKRVFLLVCEGLILGVILGVILGFTVGYSISWNSYQEKLDRAKVSYELQLVKFTKQEKEVIKRAQRYHGRMNTLALHRDQQTGDWFFFDEKGRPCKLFYRVK